MTHPFRPTPYNRNGPCVDCGAYEEDGAHMNEYVASALSDRPAFGSVTKAIEILSQQLDCDHEHVQTEDIGDGVAGLGRAHEYQHHCLDCGTEVGDDGEMDDDGTYRPSWSILGGLR